MYNKFKFSETDKLLCQLGRYPSLFNQLVIGLFNWVSLFLIPAAFLVIGYFRKKMTKCLVYENINLQLREKAYVYASYA